MRQPFGPEERLPQVFSLNLLEIEAIQLFEVLMTVVPDRGMS
jgi:hypothetical protein